MERLTTYRNGAYAYVGPGCKYPNTGDIAIEMDTGSVRAVLQKLAAYEDSELTPGDVMILKESMRPITIQDMGRFQEIMRAEKAGRLEILPCEEVSLQQTIEESRALTAAINSLRFNPDLSDIEAQSYEILLANMRDRGNKA